MVDKRAFTLARKLFRTYKTRDPFAIAEELGITVQFRTDFKRLKGAFRVLARNSFIFINANLSEEMQRLVCAHELGHALLHRQLGLGKDGLLEFEIFDIKTQCEYDANVFASTLLLDDEEILEAVQDGYDVVQTAQMMGTNVNLILLKLNEMNSKGYELRLPYEPSCDFLGTIDDNAGTL